MNQTHTFELNENLQSNNLMENFFIFNSYKKPKGCFFIDFQQIETNKQELENIGKFLIDSNHFNSNQEISLDEKGLQDFFMQLEKK